MRASSATPESSTSYRMARSTSSCIGWCSTIWPSRARWPRVFSEAARLLRPGGALVAIEPGLWHPVGLGLALANRAGVARAVHGTPDDIPLSPRRLVAEARAAGLVPELHAVTYTWRRLPPGVQRSLQPLDALGSRRRAAVFGHTLMLIARRPADEPAISPRQAAKGR